jgi:hypothetical protein
MEQRYDAAFSAFIEQQLRAQESTLYKPFYEGLKARQWLPIKQVPPGAQTFGYNILDGYGRAAVISHASDELPTGGLGVEQRTGRLVIVGASIIYSREELRAAQYAQTQGAGFDLETEQAELQMRAVEEQIQSLALTGNHLDSNGAVVTGNVLGFTGFFNNPDVPVLTSGVDFDSGATSGAAMLAELRRWYNQVLTQSKGVFVPNTILFPMSTYLAINAKPVGTDATIGTTVMQAFQQGLRSPVTIDWDSNLETAGAGSTKRAVVYFKSPSVAQMVMGFEAQIYAPEYQNLTVSRAIEAKTGGTILRQPLALVYADGL